MMLTPPARRRMTDRNWLSISLALSTRWRSALVISLLLFPSCFTTLRRRAASEKALRWKRGAADFILADRSRLVGGRIVGRQCSRVAPVAIEIGHLLGRGCAARVEQ